ncbi:MAG TPA: exodeoxyribonuclease V subunit gamma [Nakamurella sp.]
MGLHVHRAERADTLARALGELLVEPPGDPFAVDVVAVPTRGVERWLTQRLSHRLGARDGRSDGVCAAVRFPSPAALIADLVGDRADDPWAPAAAVWPLLSVIDDSADEAWCAMVAEHLGYRSADPQAEHRRGRRYAVARRIAGLFDGYAEHRPDMLLAWSRGEDTDGWGSAVPSDLAWQPPLWRRLRERIGAPDPVATLQAAAARLAEDPGAVELPARVSLFGPTALPARQIRLLSALAAHRQVHLWLPHPSPELWQRVGRLHAPGPLRRRGDPSAGEAGHPLLASLGRDVRELQTVLAGRVDHDTHHPAGHPPASMLGLLQQGLAGNRRPAVRTAVDPGDDSIRVHACHGPGRQVDVLRDVVIGLLADDRTLHPSDILIMCPDIESFAPLLHGAFGLVDSVPGGHPAHRLQVRLADRALRQTNPLMAALERLLDLTGGRVTASDVLDFAAFTPVRHRFGFDDDELATLSDWVAAAGARWGLDAEHRRRYGLAEFGQNTWRAALDRVLLGVCMSDEPGNRLDTALPLDEIGSADVDLAGRLAELIARLGAATDTLADRHTVAQWCVELLAGVQSLTSVPPRASWQLAELRAELAAVQRHAAAAGSTDVRLDLGDIRALLAGALAGRPTRANFRTGTLTVCTMMPMRSVPHRVICLLGLDDGVFPRAVREDGDDLLIREPACGERDPRSEDRQLLLDAIVAATDRLVITYSGADERTGAHRPPAVPVGELLDALDDTATAPGGGVLSDAVIIRHPLQPFDSRTVSAGALGRSGPFTFDPVALGGAVALSGPRRPATLLSPEPLPIADPPPDVELDAVADLLTHPAKGFLRRRLEVAVPFEQDDPPDDLPVELDALQLYKIGDRILQDRLADVPEEECRHAEWRRGLLPPARLGGRALDAVLDEVRPLVDRTVSLRSARRRTVEVSVALPGGRRLRGTVGGVHGSTLVVVSYSRLGARARLRSWLGLLALTGTDPAVGWTAATVGRGDRGRPQCATLPPLSGDRARDLLADLVAVYEQGLAAPLPLPLKTGEKYADARGRGIDPEKAMSWAAETWVGTAKFPGERQDPANVRVWGRDASFHVLMDENRSPGFVDLTARLWLPLQQHEQRGPL